MRVIKTQNDNRVPVTLKNDAFGRHFYANNKKFGLSIKGSGMERGLFQNCYLLLSDIEQQLSHRGQSGIVTRVSN